MMIEDCSLTSWWNSGGLPAGEQATVNAVDKEVPNNLKVEEESTVFGVNHRSSLFVSFL